MNLPQIESTNEFIAVCSEVEIPTFLNIVGGLMDELKFLHPEVQGCHEPTEKGSKFKS